MAYIELEGGVSCTKAANHDDAAAGNAVGVQVASVKQGSKFAAFGCANLVLRLCLAGAAAAGMVGEFSQGAV